MTLSTGYLTDLCGIKVFTSDLLTETETYEEEVLRTWKERFVDPLLQFRFREFKPWIKTKTVQGTRQVPSKKAVMWNGSLMGHPTLFSEIQKQLNVGGVA